MNCWSIDYPGDEMPPPEASGPSRQFPFLSLEKYLPIS
jgi:hypothetical protein